IAVAMLAERTCSDMGTSRVKLARAIRWACSDGVPSRVMVQPRRGAGQCAGCGSPTVYSVSTSMRVRPAERPAAFAHCRTR
ncbi:hypothetical protein, partial [Mycolicibacterium sphagni]|uniref:hypothetical protein n=1 Tax=Mycolicibacterium sphagni TaxID=1786 RepID=UPI0027E36FF2